MGVHPNLQMMTKKMPKMDRDETPVSLFYLDELCSEEDLILDVGSKDGRYMAPLSCETVSIDIDFKSVEKDTMFVYSDGSRLAFKENTFDYVYCNQVLEHVQDKSAVLEEIARVLKSEGKAIFTFPNRLSPTKPHPTPRWYSYLPKPISKRIAPYILNSETAEYHRTSEFMITPWTARRYMETHFRSVNYMVFSHKCDYQEKYKRYQPILKKLCEIEKRPISGRILELFWHHVCYVCSKPID